MGFAEGFLAAQRIRFLRQQSEIDKQEAEAKKKYYDALFSKAQLEQQKFGQELLQQERLRLGRQQAGAASALLQETPTPAPAGPSLFAGGLPAGETTLTQGGVAYSAADRAILASPTPTTGIQLDPESRAQLQRILQRQRAAEPTFEEGFTTLGPGQTRIDPFGNPVAQTPSKRLQEIGEDRKRRAALAESMAPLLTDLSPQQRAFAGAAMNSFREGGIDDAQLLKALDRLTGAGGIPSTSMGLAYLAAGSGPQAEQARQALQLLPEEQRRVTTAELALRAEGSGPEAEAARRALETLKALRQTGVAGGRRSRAEEPPAKVAPVVPGSAEDPTFQGKQFEGRGRFGPKVKSFKRIK